MKALYEKIKNNPELLKEVMTILAKGETEGEAVVKAELEAFAARNGAKVTYDEIKAFLEDMQANGELSESELDMVAGGKVDPVGVIASVVSVGIACGIMSIVKAAKKQSCKERFHEEV